MRERLQDWAERVRSEDAERIHAVVVEMRSASLSSSQMVYKKVADIKSGHSWSSVASSQELG